MSAQTRSALVTGATGGLGRALVMALSNSGYTTFAVARDSARLNVLVEDRPGPGLIVPVVADVTSPTDVSGLASEVNASTNSLDIVIANAGIALDNSFVTPSEPLEAWREMVLVNVFGPAAVARELLPLLLPAGGSIVLVGSVVGRAVIPGDLYSVTKHAVAALAANVRAEVEPLGVRVCLVQPGLIDTPAVHPSRRHRPMLEAGEVADEILRAVTGDPRLQRDEISLRRLSTGSQT